MRAGTKAPEMQTFLMAAGRGTRLAPFTDVAPKPVIPVANEPAMGHLLRLLAMQGFTNVVSNIHWKADLMQGVFGSGDAWGVNLSWSVESELLGNAGGMKNAEGWLRDGDSPILVLSGDGLHDVDLSAVVRHHLETGAMATLVLKEVADPSLYGVAVQDSEGWITGFQEKPPAGTSLSNVANTGIYVFSPEVFDLIPKQFYDFGSDLFVRMVAERMPIQGYVHSGYWNDIGDLEQLRKGSLAVVGGDLSYTDAPDESSLWGQGILVHPKSEIDSRVELVGRCVIGEGVRIGAGSTIIDSVLLPGTEISPDTVVADSLLGSLSGLNNWVGSLAHELKLAD